MASHSVVSIEYFNQSQDKRPLFNHKSQKRFFQMIKTPSVSEIS